MAYPKFDDPNKKVATGARKINDAFMTEAMRRGIQGITNRVIGGTNGTQGPLITAGIAAAGSAGVQIANALTCVINGVKEAIVAQDNLALPSGTQGKNTVAKYLVSVGAGTSGTVSGPGNVIDKGEYLTIALATAAAKLPDLPDGHCAVGYVTVNAPTLTDIVFADDSALGTTGGTAAYQDLVCMPYEA